MSDKPRKLSDKQDLFCREYIIDHNAYQAAIRADYSETTAKAKSAGWLEKVGIRERINELKARITKKLDVTAERVVAELAKLGFSNIQDFINVDNEGEAYFKSFSNIERDELAAIASIKISSTTDKGDSDTEHRTIDFKLYDKAGALEKLGKYLGIFKELGPNAEKEAVLAARMTEAERKYERAVAKVRLDEECRAHLTYRKGEKTA